MSYKADGSLADLAPEALVREAPPEIARRVVAELHDEVVRRTPIAKMPEAYQGNFAAWMEDREGRRPGTLRSRWRSGEPVEGPPGFWTVEEVNDDPVALDVEENTRPHAIRAKDPEKKLRFPFGPEFLFRRAVRHPGTTGVHMMRDALAAIEVRWVEIGRQVIDEIAARS